MKVKVLIGIKRMKFFIIAIISGIVIQLLTLTGSYNYDSIFPYLLFVYLFSIGISVQKGEKYELNKQLVIKGASSLAIVIIVLYNLIAEGFIYVDNWIQVSSVAIIGIILYIIFGRIISKIKAMHFTVWGGAILFGIFSALGHFSMFENGSWTALIRSFFCWGFLFLAVLELIYQISCEITFFGGKDLSVKPWILGTVAFGIIVLCDLIWLLNFFPGVMTYDSYMQMCQVYGDAYSNHHPWIHTMMIKGIFEIGKLLLHSTNRAYALYSLCSICLLAVSFALSVAYLCRRGLKTIFCVILIFLYALSPINQMFSIIMWKDVPFAAFILLFIILLCWMRDNQNEGRSNLLCWILFVPLSFCVCFFRSNGLFVFLFLIPFLVVTFWREKRAVISAIGIVLCMAVFYIGMILPYFNVKEPDLIESLSVPAQQIAAVLAYGGDVTEEQKEQLSEIVDLEKVKKGYLDSIHCSDTVKNLVREKNNQEYMKDNALSFLRLYLEMFRKNKGIYIKAFVDETQGYWYHKINYFFIWATYIEDNGMGIDRDGKLPVQMSDAMSQYLSNYKEHFDKYESIGLYVYLLFIAFLTALRKKSRYLVVYIPLIGIWGTLLLATPVYAEFRYAYSIYIAVPLLFTMIFKEKEACPIEKKDVI